MCHNILKAAKKTEDKCHRLITFLKTQNLKYKKNLITFEFKNTFFYFVIVDRNIDVDRRRQWLPFCRLTAGSPFHHALHRNAQ